MIGTSKAKTPSKYLGSLPESRRRDVQATHDAIRKTVPEWKPYMMAGMLAYGRIRYKTASGREGDWSVVALCNRKDHVSLYLCAGDKHGYLAEQNKHRLGKVSVGKSCIRFRKLADLNLKVAMDLVKKAARLASKTDGITLL
jgi:hypothetical protein